MSSKQGKGAFLWFGVGATLVVAGALGIWLETDRVTVSGAPLEAAQPSSQDLSSDASGSSSVQEEHALRPVDCWVEVPDQETRCGVLTVSSGPTSRASVELAVLRVLHPGPSQGPPLVFLQGGPGYAVIETLTSSLAGLIELAAGRELIFIDPRGTGYSKPRFDCREAGSLPESLLKCYETHSVEVDPSDFTTAAAVRDLVAVQRALRHERWDVLATSYGTRWALSLIRDFPGSVRAVVLDSPVPLQVDLIAQLGSNAYGALSRMVQACAAQVDCRRAYPRLGQDLGSVVSALSRAPVQTDGGRMDADRFVRGVFGFLYAPATAAYVPQILHRATLGDFALFTQLERRLASQGFSLGAHLSIQCAEEVPFTNVAAIDQADAVVPEEFRSLLSGRTYLEDCGIWRVRPAGPRENQPVVAEHPALIVVGDMDPVTPPAYGELIHADLPNSRLLVVQGGAHAAGLDSCGIQLIDSFLRRPGEPLPLSCANPDGEATLSPGEKIQAGTSLSFRTRMPTQDELNELRIAQ